MASTQSDNVKGQWTRSCGPRRFETARYWWRLLAAPLCGGLLFCAKHLLIEGPCVSRSTSKLRDRRDTASGGAIGYVAARHKIIVLIETIRDLYSRGRFTAVEALWLISRLRMGCFSCLGRNRL